MNDSRIAPRQYHEIIAGILAICFVALGLQSTEAGSATWSVAPADGDWNNMLNWNPPTTVPNSPSDVATFDTSTTIGISLSAGASASQIIFDPGASAFTITATPAGGLGLYGAGITNNSGVTQTFVTSASGTVLSFNGSATAGTSTSFANNASIQFLGFSTAGAGTFTNIGSSVSGSYGGALGFFDHSTAGHANITNNGGLVSGANGGLTQFIQNSTLGSATFTNEAGAVAGANGGTTEKYDASGVSGISTFINNGAAVSGAGGGTTTFFDGGPQNGTVTNNGGSASGARGGVTTFFNSSNAGGGTIIANGGTNGGGGGTFFFRDDSHGSNSVRAQIFGNGSIDLSARNAGHVGLGSLEGDGDVFLGANQIWIGSVFGTNSTFAGVIQDGGTSGGVGGSLSKFYPTILTLSGSNTYTGGTEISAGTILVKNTSGSGTGSGSVLVDNGATLGGTGTVQLGAGATLTNNGTIAPGDSPGQLNVNGNIQLGYSSNLSFEIGGTTPATQYDVLNKIDNGALTLKGKLTLSLVNGFTPQSSDTFAIVTTQTTLAGKFTNVKDGGRINTTDGSGSFQVNYAGLNNVVLSNSGAPLSPSQNQNISTRVDVGTGDNVAIGGFIVTGTVQKKVIIRGIGPSLSGAGLQNVLANPTLELHDQNGVIATNDDWKEHQSEVEATGLQPTNDLESAIVIMLNPGTYTVILAGKTGGTGIGMIEVYDLDPAADAQLANISTRGFVGTGDNVMIGGVIVGPNNTNAITVVIRAIGPSLSGSGIANPLQDPVLELHDGNGAVLAVNDNWKDIQQADINATGLSPTNDAESAIMASLAPGVYTAVVHGANSTSGVGLAEVYEVP